MKNNTMKAMVMVAAIGGFIETALPAEENELVKEEDRGRWTLSFGPSWRSRVKMETRGTVYAPTPVARQTIASRDMDDPANWEAEGAAEKVADPLAGTRGVPEDGQVWQISSMRTEIYGIAGEDYVVNRSDEDAPLGLNLQAGYDLYQGETWSVSLNLRFAAYWNMKSSSSGSFNAGYTRTEYYNDNYIFPDCPVMDSFAEDVNPSYNLPESNGSTVAKATEYTDYGSHIVNTRLRTDLYQIGLGPKVTWSPFAGWCRPLAWIDVYGGVEALCNIAHSKFDADGSSSSSTDCLLGFGGNVGFVGNITDWCGIYGQVGYEWIDDADVSTGGFKAEVDYSSLVLSAGVQFRF